MAWLGRFLYWPHGCPVFGRTVLPEEVGADEQQDE
jgi:hypothetical protein